MLNQKQSEILLASVIFARSTSLLFSKLAMGALAPFNLLALRFGIAFALLLLLFHKRLKDITRKELLCGCILGILFTTTMGFELFGLRLTDTATTAFIENSAMVLVPLLQMLIFRKFPRRIDVIAILLAITGIGFLTLTASGGLLSGGCIYLMFAATFYASAILAGKEFSAMGDPFRIGAVQVGAIGLFSLVLSLTFEQPRLPQTGAELLMVLALAVVCSGFGFTLQPVAQRGTTAERAGSMCAITPLSASVLGIIFLKESISAAKVTGAIFIMAGLFSEPILRLLSKNKARD